MKAQGKKAQNLEQKIDRILGGFMAKTRLGQSNAPSTPIPRSTCGWARVLRGHRFESGRSTFGRDARMPQSGVVKLAVYAPFVRTAMGKVRSLAEDPGSPPNTHPRHVHDMSH